jgi:hypothetical protein
MKNGALHHPALKPVEAGSNVRVSVADDNGFAA